MVLLGVIEGTCRSYLGGDGAMAFPGKGVRVTISRGLCTSSLLVTLVVDRGPVLGTRIVPLAHPLSRIVLLEEDLQKIVERDALWIEDNQHDLGVAGSPAAYLLVGGMGRDSARVSHGRRDDAGQVPEQALGSPEATKTEDRAFGPLGPWWPDPRAIHGMDLGDGEAGRVSTGKGLVGSGQLTLLTVKDHEKPPLIEENAAVPTMFPWTLGYISCSTGIA